MSNIPSVIKWTGSKRKQAQEIVNLSPRYERYIEPFLGGGSVLFLASNRAQESICSDIYNPLIKLWNLIKNSPDSLVLHYSQLWEELSNELDDLSNSPDFQRSKAGYPKVYYNARARFNAEPNPFDLNFILRTCVNGIVRFNSQGEFNNSFHLSRRGMRPETFEKNVLVWNKTIQNTNFLSQDYEETIRLAKSTDFVYLDPPYLNSNNRYIAQLDFDRLIENLDWMNRKNIKWALSFDGTRGERVYEHTIPDELYKNCYSISNGISTIKNTLSKKKEYVLESLYTNY